VRGLRHHGVRLVPYALVDDRGVLAMVCYPLVHRLAEVEVSVDGVTTMTQEPKTQATVQRRIRLLWAELGRDPRELDIKADELGWSNSAGYKVSRKGHSVLLDRKLIDDIGRDHEIKAILKELLD
jgi:hypothetical protein